MPSEKIYPCILSGGSGTRLWPISRKEAPKQLQPLLSDNTLIVDTAKRFDTAKKIAAPVIICNAAYADEISTQLVRGGSRASHIIAEPVARNTAPAAALAAQLIHELDPNGLILLLPADHYIPDTEAFLSALTQAKRAARSDYIVTFGIKPRTPDTGFGYIKAMTASPLFSNIYRVDQFVEKPTLERAKAYLDEGNYSWNSGIFLFKPEKILSELRAFAPDILKASKIAYQGKSLTQKNGTCFYHIDKPSFETCPDQSIDYAVMEKTAHAAVMLSDFFWSDVGGWAAIYDLGEKNEAQNVLKGDVLTYEAKGNLILSNSRLVCAAGVENTIIVETADAVLVCPIEKTPLIGNIIPHLSKAFRREANQHACSSDLSYISSRHELKQWYRDWLITKALPFWSYSAIDPKTGGSFEACSLLGKELTDLPVRLRVHARQVFTFAFACDQFDWCDGAKALGYPLQHLLTTGQKDDGGWGHIYNPDGSWADDKSDTYDHAFVLSALAWAFKVTGEPGLRSLAMETLDYLVTMLKHPVIGYHEGLPSSKIRRANPHMHLLEAALYWSELHKEDRFLALSHEIVNLFSSYFYKEGVVREYFHDDLSVNDQTTHLSLIEPGHLYEWAFLLEEYSRITGSKAPITKPMTAFADKYGWNKTPGLVADYCHPTGISVLRPTARLWPQTEYIRWALSYGNDTDINKALHHLEIVKSHYLSINGAETGLWRDKLGHTGADISENVPASTLYHLIGMIATI